MALLVASDVVSLVCVSVRRRKFGFVVLVVERWCSLLGGSEGVVSAEEGCGREF